ncbi:MAG: SPOR domain-containing protein [Alphaproteobacteria bacterium]|nr:SPOR domain-containing protein [Alphaproteobacteria bacterium]
MNLSPKDDDRLWREPEKTSWFRFPHPLRYFLFLIFLIGFMIGLWYLISPTREWYEKTEIPLIKADQAPYKVKAESQGVPSVKHQDKLVYGRIRADQSEPVAEHILPDPEAPMPLIQEESATLKMVDQYAPEDGDPDKGEDAIQQKPEKKEEVVIKSIEDLIDEVPEEKEIPEPKVSKGKTHIQLASLKSYDTAEAEWDRLSKKHADVLGKLERTIQKVDLGEEQGIYYRLRTGPFDDAQKANEACAALKERKVECVVVR